MPDPESEHFDRLWRECAPAVLRYARRRVVPADVEDVVAETFIVAWRRRGDVPDYALPWLLEVARGVSANARRAGRRRAELLDRATLHEGVAAQHTPPGDRLAVTAAALNALSEPDRELLTLLAWDDLTPAEAAVVLGCSDAALRVRLHRARRRLSELLQVATPPLTHPVATPALGDAR